MSAPSRPYPRLDHHRRLLSRSPPPPPPSPPHLQQSSTDVPAAAVAGGTPPASSSSSRSAIPMLLPVFILFVILLGFLSIFLFRDFLHFTSILLSSSSRQRHHAPDNGGPESEDVDGARPAGLDPAILASFPTLPYSAVRGLQEGKCGQECAVCLGEFSGGDVIRLLTVCCHAFHPPCIDSWLDGHATCPVCRSDLQAPPDEAAVLAVREAVGSGHSGAASEESGEEGSRRMAKTRSGARHAITIDEG